MNKSKAGILCVSLCYISWGLLPIFWKNMSFLDSTYTMCVRLFWSSVVYLCYVMYNKKLHLVPEILRDKKQVLFILITGVSLTFNWWIYIYAVSIGKIIETSLAYYINPMLAILSGAFFFREKLLRSQWIAVAIAATGIIYSVVNYGKVPTVALFIAVTFVIYGGLKKVSTIDRDVSLMLETVFMLPFAAAYVIYAESHGLGYIGQLSVSQYALFPMCGLATAVPLILYSHGIETTPMSLSGILMFMNPTIQILIALLVYGESFKPSDYVMFPCVWLGVIIFIIANVRQHKKSHTFVG